MADISKLEEQAILLFDDIAGWESSTLQRIGNRIGKYVKNFPCRNVIKSVYLVIALIAVNLHMKKKAAVRKYVLM